MIENKEWRLVRDKSLWYTRNHTKTYTSRHIHTPAVNHYLIHTQLKAVNQILIQDTQTGCKHQSMSRGYSKSVLLPLATLITCGMTQLSVERLYYTAINASWWNKLSQEDCCSQWTANNILQPRTTVIATIHS